MDYNAFYNGTIIHTKDNNFGDLVSNDNPSSSLTLVESDGLFEKEKINRVGNVLYQINARYDSVDDIQSQWIIDREFYPELEKEKIENLLHYWHKAVKCAQNWIEE